jgi:hypothetical protein
MALLCGTHHRQKYIGCPLIGQRRIMLLMLLVLAMPFVEGKIAWFDM